MAEHLYTIAINEHFGKKCGCPVCSLRNMIEKNEIDAITGAAMMEPSVRIQTNRHGFCFDHFSMMMKNGKRLPVALILQSHLEEIEAALDGAKPEKAEKYLRALTGDCYVCAKMNEKMERVLSNVVYLWHTDEKFRTLFSDQPGFCLPHYRRLTALAQEKMSKKQLHDFASALSSVQDAYLAALNEDISWFCKKFDYRYDAEPWYNSRDAVERAIKFLSSDIHRNEK